MFSTKMIELSIPHGIQKKKEKKERPREYQDNHEWTAQSDICVPGIKGNQSTLECVRWP